MKNIQPLWVNKKMAGKLAFQADYVVFQGTRRFLLVFVLDGKHTHRSYIYNSAPAAKRAGWIKA